MNDIRWSEHALYAEVVKRVPPELHPTLARAVDLRAADAWLHEGTMPAGLDSDGKSLGGQQGPTFLRAAGRRYLRRWVTDEHGEQFGKGEAGMLLDKWIDEMLAFTAGLGGRGRGHLVAAGGGWKRSTFWSTAVAASRRRTATTRSGKSARARPWRTSSGCTPGDGGTRRTSGSRGRARTSASRSTARRGETLAWVLANRVMHDEDELE